MQVRRFAASFVPAACLALAAPALLAQSFPSRTIRLVVPQSPGGGTDVLARNLAQKLGEALGQAVVIENRPGADGMIGTDYVAKSAGDGYTLLMVSSSHAINPTMYPKIPFDTMRDLSCIMQPAAQQVVLVVHPSLPANNVKELIAYARANPNKLSFASASSATQLPMEMFNVMAGTRMTNIPYKGSGPAVTDMLSGLVPTGFGGGATVLPHIKAGKLRALGVGGDHRWASLPDVPTIAEAGLRGFNSIVWSGLFTSSSTPRPIIEKLNRELAKIMSEPEFRDKLRGSGYDPIGTTPEQCDAFIAAEISKWAKVVKDAGIKPE